MASVRPVVAMDKAVYARVTMVTGESFTATVNAAADLSLLRGFPAAERERLLVNARRMDVTAGSIFFLGATPQPSLVVSGVIKVFLTAADGRQVTIHYIKPGGTLGIFAMVGGPPPVSLQAIAPSTVLMLDAPAVREIATRNTEAAWAVAEEMASIYRTLLSHVAVNVFGNVRQRVCNHLLNMAAGTEDGTLIAGPITQQELANAVGTAREVVSRTLGSLSRAGVISVSRDRIMITHPSKMLDEVGTISSI